MVPSLCWLYRIWYWIILCYKRDMPVKWGRLVWIKFKISHLKMYNVLDIFVGSRQDIEMDWHHGLCLGIKYLPLWSATLSSSMTRKNVWMDSSFTRQLPSQSWIRLSIWQGLEFPPPSSYLRNTTLSWWYLFEVIFGDFFWFRHDSDSESTSDTTPWPRALAKAVKWDARS